LKDIDEDPDREEGSNGYLARVRVISHFNEKEAA
jgi:hypothetical protein